MWVSGMIVFGKGFFNLLGLEELLKVNAYETNESRKIHRFEIIA